MTTGTTQGISRQRAARALRRAAGALSTLTTGRMQEEVAWFQELSAEERAWVGQIVQAGIGGFVDWFEDGAVASVRSTSGVTASVFGAAPRTLTGAISLQQTVDLVRLSIEVLESHVEDGDLLDPDDRLAVQAAMSRYAREVAFAAAEVYARAAEARGAWDARLEALVVDAVLRAETDEAVLSRASAVGWATGAQVVAVLGRTPERRADSDLFDEVRRVARASGLDALCAVQGERLVVLLGGLAPEEAAPDLVDLFGTGPVVIGPVSEDLAHAHVSARAALSAHRAAGGWPGAPRPVHSHQLLPERALSGDGHARRFLVEEVHRRLAESRGALLETVAAYLESGGSIEATARELFVHPNTVRYRLRQAAEVTGFSPTLPRDGLALQVAIILGRQSAR
ncbi:helix-turn-helix domain-containing protein [Nocardioides nanhaiensis]|uniref:Fatty acid biosynthesis transcriptional regulator FasR n=1 Tax=Nocardioides nanhaiensis TaxID=1476871 RepID=A0ABP8WIG1_9ACTN